jgi:hypothetical protein
MDKRGGFFAMKKKLLLLGVIFAVVADGNELSEGS